MCKPPARIQILLVVLFFLFTIGCERKPNFEQAEKNLIDSYFNNKEEYHRLAEISTHLKQNQGIYYYSQKEIENRFYFEDGNSGILYEEQIVSIIDEIGKESTLPFVNVKLFSSYVDFRYYIHDGNNLYTATLFYSILPHPSSTYNCYSIDANWYLWTQYFVPCT